MNRFTLALAAAALVVTCALGEARADVRWHDGALDPVLTEARQAQRLVLIDFGAEWCGPCQTMDSTVWSRADVGSAVAQGYVPLKVDADSSVGAALMRRFNVGALPTVIAVRADGTEIDRLTGDNDGATVLATLSAWRRGDSTLSVLAVRAAQRPHDLALRLDVGTRYADRGDEAHASENLRAVIEGDPRNAQGYRSRALLALGDRLYLRSLHDATRALGPLQDLVRSCPESEAATRAAVPLAAALHRTQHDAEAIRVIEAHLTGATAGTIGSRANSVAWMMFREHWDLPRAEVIARSGVTRAPRDHALVDTLAEIVFEQGRAHEAAEIERGAARLDPQNAYYRQQIARFEAAPSSPPPAAESAPVSSAPPSNPSAAPARTVHSAPATRRAVRTGTNATSHRPSSH